MVPLEDATAKQAVNVSIYNYSGTPATGQTQTRTPLRSLTKDQLQTWLVDNFSYEVAKQFLCLDGKDITSLLDNWQTESGIVDLPNLTKWKLLSKLKQLRTEGLRTEDDKTEEATAPGPLGPQTTTPGTVQIRQVSTTINVNTPATEKVHTQHEE